MSKVEGRCPIDPPPPLMPSCDFFYLMPPRVKPGKHKLNSSCCLEYNFMPNMKRLQFLLIQWRKEIMGRY